jgi:hypothetical protein
VGEEATANHVLVAVSLIAAVVFGLVEHWYRPHNLGHGVGGKCRTKSCF